MKPAVSWLRFDPASESFHCPPPCVCVHTALSFSSSKPDESRQPPSSVPCITMPKPSLFVPLEAATCSWPYSSLPPSTTAPKTGISSGIGGITLMMPCTALEP